jgi:hypothetical protein
MRLLEAHVETQEQILAAMQAERIEAERLNESVTRLGMGASDLGAALLQVDKTQQMLTKLGTDIRRVETEAATSVEVEAKVADAKAEAARKLKRAELHAANERRRLMARLYAGGVVSLAALLAISLAAVNAVRAQERDAQANCERGLLTTKAVVSYLEDVEATSTNPVLVQSAGEVIAVLPPKNTDARKACAQ